MASPNEAILDPSYWADRLNKAHYEHQAIYRCTLPEWERIEAKHKEILAKTIGPAEWILDCGCGWGRLLTLLPADWKGDYYGVDVSPDFIAMGEERFGSRIHLSQRRMPQRHFLHMNMTDVDKYGFARKFDWAVFVSVRPMIIRNLGAEYWMRVERSVREVANKLLFLEFDETHNGTVE